MNIDTVHVRLQSQCHRLGGLLVGLLSAAVVSGIPATRCRQRKFQPQVCSTIRDNRSSAAGGMPRTNVQAGPLGPHRIVRLLRCTASAINGVVPYNQNARQTQIDAPRERPPSGGLFVWGSIAFPERTLSNRAYSIRGPAFRSRDRDTEA
jgi:hypothetical protein